MKTRIMLTGMLVAAVMAQAQVAPQTAAEEASIVYEMRAGDTLESLCEKFLGGAEYLPELIGYNRIADPASVVEGTLIVIPQRDRNNAIAELSRVETGLARALAAKADEYAPEAYAKARELTGEVRTARELGSYSQAVAISKLALLTSTRARQLADERAPIQDPAEFVVVYNRVALSTDDGQTWVAAKVGDVIPVPSRVMTEPGSRAEIRLGDGSRLQVDEASEIEVQDFILDRRDGLRRSRLRVIMGGILGHVEPEKVEASEFEIDTGEASVAIRGTELRVTSDRANTTLSVLSGATEMSAGGESVAVPADFGSHAKAGAPPAKAVALLAHPAGLTPAEPEFRTADQTPAFTWSQSRDRTFGSYHLEIATEPKFNELVLNYVGMDPTCVAGILPAGTYYWRVATRDKNGIEGRPCETRQLEVVKDLAILLTPEGDVMKVGDKFLCRPTVACVARTPSPDTSVVAMEYSVNGSDFKASASAIQLTEDGAYQVRARGVAADGARGEEAKIVMRVDGTAPLVTARVDEKAADEASDVRYVVLDATDVSGVKSLEYSMNGKPFATYSGPVVCSTLDDIQVSYRAMDQAGNASTVGYLNLPGEWVPRR